MGLSVYLENQIHERESGGPELGRHLEKCIPHAQPGGVLYFTSEYGDTMFNIPQMRAILGELDGIHTSFPELNQEVSSLKEVITKAIRRRGYLWVSGD